MEIWRLDGGEQQEKRQRSNFTSLKGMKKQQCRHHYVRQVEAFKPNYKSIAMQKGSVCKPVNSSQTQGDQICPYPL